MKEIKLSEQQAKNVLVFMERTQLSGKEVPEWVKISNTINDQLNSEHKESEVQ